MALKLTRPQLIERLAREVLGWEVCDLVCGIDTFQRNWFDPSCGACRSYSSWDPTRSGSDLDVVIESVRPPRYLELTGPTHESDSWLCGVYECDAEGSDIRGMVREHADRRIAVCLAVLGAHLGEAVELEGE